MSSSKTALAWQKPGKTKWKPWSPPTNASGKLPLATPKYASALYIFDMRRPKKTKQSNSRSCADKRQPPTGMHTIAVDTTTHETLIQDHYGNFEPHFMQISQSRRRHH